jgi:heptaprenyl diphosphate synthase
MFSTRRLVYLSLLLAMATALHVLEGLFPIPLPFPGVKLGLANIVTLLVLYLYDLRAGLTVAIARVLLGSLLGGTFLSPGFLLGLTGAVVSKMVMALLVKKTGFSALGISLAGAIGHNLGQLVMAALLLQSQAIFFYLPFLLLAAIPTGLVTGYILQRLRERLEKTGILPELTRNSG